MHQRKSKIILIYFFLLILFSSINNLSFSKIKFEKIKNINVNGLTEIDNQIIKKKINSLNLENIFFLNKNEIDNVINSNTLVENYEIFKKYPSSLDIKIKKTDLLAMTNKNSTVFLLGSNSKLTRNNNLNLELPYIFGELNIDEFLKFKKKIDQSKIPYNEIKNFYFYKSKRWDLELKNKTIIKLPKKYKKESLDYVSRLLKDTSLKNLEMIDLRVEGQIILND